ncbi:MAG: phage/plasmid primase, P4 family [Chloroflexota bacterium]
MDAITSELVAMEEPADVDDAVMGDAFIATNAGHYAFLWGEWHHYHNQRGLWQQAERKAKRDMVDHLKTYRRRKIKVTASRVKGVLEYCENYLPPEDTLPQNGDLIPMRNGVFNVRTGVLHAHAAENYFRHGLDFDYNPQAHCEHWKLTLEQILVTPAGRTDFDLIAFVQEAMGYCFWGDNRLQAAFLFYGDGGTGKSTIIEVLQSMIQSAVPIDLETLNEYQMASLVDVRLAVVSEFEDNATFPEAAFKRLLSSDLVQARFPHGRPFSFQPVCTVVGAMNTLPRVKDRSHGVFRRVFIVPFHRVVASPDVYLAQKLQKEAPGIFAWAMEGLARLRDRGHFQPPQQVVDAGNEWRYRNDTERQFINSRYVRVNTDGLIASAELYRLYKEWCKENGTYAKSQAAVARDWKRLGFTSEKKREGMHWRGVESNEIRIDLNHL